MLLGCRGWLITLSLIIEEWQWQEIECNGHLKSGIIKNWMIGQG